MRPNPNRRSVLAAGALLAGAAAAPGALAATSGLTLFDPDEPAARAFAAARGGRSIAIRGDRIRLARRLFASGAPDRITVAARHADVLLLADAAREAGYRALAVDPFPALDGRGGLFLWTGKRAV